MWSPLPGYRSPIHGSPVSVARSLRSDKSEEAVSGPVALLERRLAQAETTSRSLEHSAFVACRVTSENVGKGASHQLFLLQQASLDQHRTRSPHQGRPEGCRTCPHCSKPVLATSFKVHCASCQKNSTLQPSAPVDLDCRFTWRNAATIAPPTGGPRTEVCPTCSAPVLIHSFARHRLKCQQRADEQDGTSAAGYPSPAMHTRFPTWDPDPLLAPQAVCLTYFTGGSTNREACVAFPRKSSPSPSRSRSPTRSPSRNGTSATSSSSNSMTMTTLGATTSANPGKATKEGRTVTFVEEGHDDHDTCRYARDPAKRGICTIYCHKCRKSILANGFAHHSPRCRGIQSGQVRAMLEGAEQSGGSQPSKEMLVKSPPSAASPAIKYRALPLRTTPPTPTPAPSAIRQTTTASTRSSLTSLTTLAGTEPSESKDSAPPASASATSAAATAARRAVSGGQAQETSGFPDAKARSSASSLVSTMTVLEGKASAVVSSETVPVRSQSSQQQGRPKGVPPLNLSGSQQKVGAGAAQGTKPENATMTPAASRKAVAAQTAAAQKSTTNKAPPPKAKAAQPQPSAKPTAPPAKPTSSSATSPPPQPASQDPALSSSQTTTATPVLESLAQAEQAEAPEIEPSAVISPQAPSAEAAHSRQEEQEAVFASSLPEAAAAEEGSEIPEPAAQADSGEGAGAPALTEQQDQDQKEEQEPEQREQQQIEQEQHEQLSEQQLEEATNGEHTTNPPLRRCPPQGQGDAES